MAQSDERQPRLVVTENGRTYERPFFGPTIGRCFDEVWVVDAKSTYPMQQVRIDDVVRTLRTRVGSGAKFHLGQGLPAEFEAPGRCPECGCGWWEPHHPGCSEPRFPTPERSS